MPTDVACCCLRMLEVDKDQRLRPRPLLADDWRHRHSLRCLPREIGLASPPLLKYQPPTLETRCSNIVDVEIASPDRDCLSRCLLLAPPEMNATGEVSLNGSSRFHCAFAKMVAARYDALLKLSY